MAKKRVKHDYVDNKKFFKAMCDYKDTIVDAENEGSERPIVPNYVAECIMKIATHLSHKPNFVNYTFRDDMICDGIENCLQYIDNFDPAKSNNPFAYFTQIIYFAFIRRIQKEKKQLYVKYKATQNANIFDQTAEKQDGDFESYDITIKSGEWSQDYMEAFVENFEQNKRKKRVKKSVSLDRLYAEEENEIR
jgi:DNA-directed RNA polymerase specialized sigma24 family protein